MEKRKTDGRDIWWVKSEWFAKGLDMGKARFYRPNRDKRCQLEETVKIRTFSIWIHSKALLGIWVILFLHISNKTLSSSGILTNVLFLPSAFLISCRTVQHGHHDHSSVGVHNGLTVCYILSLALFVTTLPDLRREYMDKVFLPLQKTKQKGTVTPE